MQYWGIHKRGSKTHMLVYKNDGDIPPFLCEVPECILDGRGLGFGVDDEEISLGVWGICDMLDCWGY